MTGRRVESEDARQVWREQDEHAILRRGPAMCQDLDKEYG